MFDRLEGLWQRLHDHPAFRAGAVYVGVSWVLLQAAEVFGMGTAAIRGLGLALAGTFVVLVGGLWLRERARGAAGRVLAAGGLRGKRLVATVAGLFLLGTGAWWASPRLLGGTVAPGADLIAVLPFSATGTGTADLGEGMVDLLSTSLDQVGGVRTVHPRTVMHRWQRRAGATGTLDLEGSLRVGEEVQAGSVLLGSITGTGSQVVLRAELYSTAGEALAEAGTQGSADDVLALVDDLSIRLLREVWRSNRPLPQLRVAGITTGSMDALRAYLRGERHYRAAEWDSAVVAFGDAVAADSTFALAHLRLAESYGWSAGHGADEALAHAERAAELSDRLPERERTLARAHLELERGDPQVLDTLEAYVARYPDDAMGWHLLGDTRFHMRSHTLFTDEELQAPFRRLMELDPALAVGVLHPIELALSAGDSAAVQVLLGQSRGVAPSAAVERSERAARVRFAPADSLSARLGQALRAALATPGQPSNVVVREATTLFGTAFTSALRDADGRPADLPALVDTLQAALGDRLPPMQGFMGRMGVAFTRGRIEEGLEHTRQLARLAPLPAWGNLLYMAAAGLVEPEEVSRIFPPELPEGARYYQDRLLALSRRDVDRSRALSLPEPDSTEPPWVDHLWAAFEAFERAVAGDARATAELAAALERLPFSGDAVQQTQPLRFQLALLEVEQPATRDRGIRRLTEFLNDFGYAVPAYLALAAAQEAAGRRAEAAQAYAHVVRLWSDADPELQPRVEEARRALRRLVGEGGG